MPRMRDGGRHLAEEVAILAKAFPREPGRASSSAIMRRWWAWIGVPLILAGCLAQYRYVRHAGAGAALDRSETNPDLVRVVTSKNADRPYRKIGIVHAPASLPEQDAIAALKRRARTLGGDALLDVRRQAAGASAGRDSSAPSTAPWEAVVIVWTDDQAGGVPPQPPGAKPPGASP